MADAMRSEPAMFTRKATGLVREVSLFDAFVMNTIGMNVAIGGVFLFLQAPADFPGGSMLLATVIGTVVMASTLLTVYAEFAAAMPRSGGDYVFVSRALHPVLGWLLAWSQGIWLIFFWIGFNAWFALTFIIPVSLTTIGTSTGETFWTTLSDDLTKQYTVLGIQTQWWVLVAGTVINVAFGLLLALGGRRYWRYQRGAFAFAGGAIVIAVIFMLVQGKGDVRSAWDGFVAKNGAGLRFDQVIPAARAAGYSGPKGFSLVDTILMLPWVFFVVGYAQGSAQIGGEVRSAKRTQWIAMVGGVLVNGAVLALLVILYQHMIGTDWMGSLGYLWQNAGDKLALPGGVPPSFNFTISLLTSNVVILLVIGIGFVMWALNGTPLSELQATRYMLAWSIDRTAPAKLGEVNARTNAPVAAIALATATGEVALVVLTTYAKASLLGALLAQIVAFIVVSIAGIVFPYRRREDWENAGGRRVLGIPRITLAGIGGAASLLALMLLFIFNDTVNGAFAVTRRLSLYFMIGVVVVGLIWYLGAVVYNRNRGIDLSLTYGEIPPE
jgi:amino acid transporter